MLPPTVLGYYLLMLIGARGAIGRTLAGWNIELAFTWRAAVLAAAVGSFPLLIKTAQSGFESVDRRLEQAAQTLGHSELSIFWTISVPLHGARYSPAPCWHSVGRSETSASR